MAYGLAAALVIILLVPTLRENLGVTRLTERVIKPNVMSFAYAVEQAAPSVVNIYSAEIQINNYGKQPKVNDLGSGVIMSQDGHILTNYHVVDNAELIRVLLQDGRQYDAEVLGLDEVTDLALLKIDASNLPAIPQDPELEAQVGDIVLAIGNPLNLGQTITQGIISATDKKGIGNNSSFADFIQMDAAINLGSSGGALVNSRGQLVGINTAKAQRGIQGIFFAIPYKLAKHVMTKLLEDGEVKRGYLGLDGMPINHAGVPVMSNVESIAGIRISNVDPLGPAWKGGLLSGDILLAVNGKQLVSFQELLAIIEDVEPGTTMNFSISRKGQLKQVSVVVGKLGVDD
ncbi:MAG: trypsin-like peptidase domain-containing protein [Gammaproteobacteria bacterium]|nr:trypsin-like peptidase domain-containing protein [Gammaproteobacteria bacterium]